MAEQLGADHAAVLLSAGYPQGDLHDQRYRVGEYAATQNDKGPRIVPQRRICDQAAVFGTTEYFKEMDNSNSQLAIGTESIFDYV